MAKVSSDLVWYCRFFELLERPRPIGRIDPQFVSAKALADIDGGDEWQLVWEPPKAPKENAPIASAICDGEADSDAEASEHSEGRGSSQQNSDDAEEPMHVRIPMVPPSCVRGASVVQHRDVWKMCLELRIGPMFAMVCC